MDKANNFIKRRYFIGILLFSFLFVGSCLPNIAFKSNQKNISNNDLESSNIVDVAASKWWEKYNDSQLNFLIEEALKSSPNIAIFKSRLEQAKAFEEVFGASNYPDISINSSLSKVKQSYNNGIPKEFLPQGWNSSAKIALNFNYEIDFWGKNRSKIAAAISDRKAAQAELSQSSLMFLSSILSAYSNLNRLYEDLDIAKEILESRKEVLELLEKRQKNGLENVSAVELAKVSKIEAEYLAQNLHEAIDLQKNMIIALVGIDLKDNVKIERPKISEKYLFEFPKIIELNLISNRPDIVASRLRAQSAKHRIKASEANFYPNINLAAVIGFESLGVNKLLKSNSYFGAAGPALNLPIFNRQEIKGYYRKSIADYDESVEIYNNSINQALREISDILVKKNSLDIKLKRALEAYNAAKKSYKAMLDRYQQGISNKIELLKAKDQLLQIEQQKADIFSQIFDLEIELNKALGANNYKK